MQSFWNELREIRACNNVVVHAFLSSIFNVLYFSIDFSQCSCKYQTFLFSRNRAINFDFPTKKGTGIEKLLPHASQQCIELIYKMCTYDPDERITAKQALRHSYFRDLRFCCFAFLSFAKWTWYRYYCLKLACYISIEKFSTKLFIHLLVHFLYVLHAIYSLSKNRIKTNNWWKFAIISANNGCKLVGGSFCSFHFQQHVIDEMKGVKLFPTFLNKKIW